MGGDLCVQNSHIGRDVLSAADAAQFLGLSAKTLEKWRSEGKGPPFLKLGRRVAYSRGAIVQWLEGQETRGAGENPSSSVKFEVTTRPYWKDRTRLHVDIMFAHPHTASPVRRRVVAPVGLDAALATEWGRSEGMKLYMELCKVPKSDAGAESEEDARSTKTPKRMTPQVPTLAEIWDEFIENHVRGLKRASNSGYAESWRNHIKGLVGHYRLDELDAVALNQFRTKLAQRGQAVATQKQIISRVRTCLEWAVVNGRTKTAVPKVKYPKANKKPKEVYSRDEWERMIAAATTLRDRVLALLVADGVLRIGETVGLMWSDIRWDQRVMRIQRNVLKGHLQTSPKGEIGDVPLTPRLESALRQFQAAGDPNPFVLGRVEKGKLIHGSDGTGRFLINNLQTAAELTAFGPHRIRHSVLTYLAESGVEPYALQSFARHADMTTTNRYYVHINRLKLARKAVDVLANNPPPTPAPLVVLGNGEATNGNGPRLRVV